MLEDGISIKAGKHGHVLTIVLDNEILHVRAAMSQRECLQHLVKYLNQCKYGRKVA